MQSELLRAAADKLEVNILIILWMLHFDRSFVSGLARIQTIIVMRVEMYTTGAHMLYKCASGNFTRDIGLQVHLRETQS
jgi:hypothetical protein